MGLNDSFDSIRDKILLLKPVPFAAKAYSMLLRVEKQRETHIQFGDPMEQSAHLVRSGYNNASRGSYQHKQIKKGDKFCTNCKEGNHVKENCFKLIGYQDW